LKKNPYAFMPITTECDGFPDARDSGKEKTAYSSPNCFSGKIRRTSRKREEEETEGGRRKKKEVEGGRRRQREAEGGRGEGKKKREKTGAKKITKIGHVRITDHPKKGSLRRKKKSDARGP
jgi:hypothetical protein